MSTSVPCSRLVHALSSRAHGIRQLPRLSSTAAAVAACVSASTMPCGKLSAVAVAESELAPAALSCRLNNRLRARFAGAAGVLDNHCVMSNGGRS